MKACVTTIFGPNINTDDIIRADILQEEWDKKAFAHYAFDKFDPAFRDRCRSNTPNAVVAGQNFGSGSSREQAVYAIQHNNVAFVIAAKDKTTGTAFPDIFYRNSINNGLPLISIDVIDDISMDDMLELDLDKRELTNVTKGCVYHFDMPDADLAVLNSGGLIGMARDDIRARLIRT